MVGARLPEGTSKGNVNKRHQGKDKKPTCRWRNEGGELRLWDAGSQVKELGSPIKERPVVSVLLSVCWARTDSHYSFQWRSSATQTTGRKSWEGSDCKRLAKLGFKRKF